MLRTTPPPDGIGFVLKLSDFGSNLTRVLGLTPDSLYHTSSSLVMAMPYGSDSEPPGDDHSFSSFPADGSKCPRYPRAKSCNKSFHQAPARCGADAHPLPAK